MKPRRPKTIPEQIAILSEEILDLTVQQIGSSIAVFEALHVQIMEKQAKRRELESPPRVKNQRPWVVELEKWLAIPKLSF